jgi:hypothetical protein
MRITITQAIEELIQIRDRVGDVWFESTIHGEIVEENTKQCFATDNFHIVAVDKDFCPPDLVVTPINRHY